MLYELPWPLSSPTQREEVMLFWVNLLEVPDITNMPLVWETIVVLNIVLSLEEVVRVSPASCVAVMLELEIVLLEDP